VRVNDATGEVEIEFVPQEQRELLHLLIDRVVVDLNAGGFRITFHELRVAPPSAPTGAQRTEEAIS